MFILVSLRLFTAKARRMLLLFLAFVLANESQKTESTDLYAGWCFEQKLLKTRMAGQNQLQVTKTRQLWAIAVCLVPTVHGLLCLSLWMNNRLIITSVQLAFWAKNGQNAGPD